MKKDVITMENSMEVLQKIINRTTIWSNSPTSGIFAEDLKSESWKDTSNCMFIEALFIYNSQDVEISKCPSTYEWIKK